MKKKYFALAATALGVVALTSCNTPTGQGAAAGAVGGAVVGGPVGAAVGAAGGAVVGSLVEENQVHLYAPAPKAGYPLAKWTGTPGFYRSPYTQRVYDLRGIRHGGLVRDTDTNKLFRKP